jgi:hypothetical protein
VPDLTEDLLASVDQPLEVRRCPRTKRDYLLCDYNRDGDSYRSPWSNEFDPPLEDGTVPSERVRKLEVAANDAFDVYRELYYEGGVGSVYFWDLDDGFAGVVLLKKGRCPFLGYFVFDLVNRSNVLARCRYNPWLKELWRMGQHPCVRGDGPGADVSLQAHEHCYLASLNGIGRPG